VSSAMLDTCTLLWLAGDQDQLSGHARAAIVAAKDGLYVSAMSAWEIGIAAGRL
jgi:PIN domain nuclease of toxin-antitoxin system